MQNLKQLETRIDQATVDLQHACEARWPKGTRIGFIRRHGQKNASLATVESHSGGDVRVTYVVNVRYRGAVTRYKRIHWSSIVT